MQVLSSEAGEPTGGSPLSSSGAEPLMRTPSAAQSGLPAAPADISDGDAMRTIESALHAVTPNRRTLAADETLFQQVVKAHGFDPNRTFTLGVQNFVVGPATRGGVPFAPLSDPNGDIYLGFSGPAASGETDVVITNRCQPGYLDALRASGLLHESTVVIEVDPLVVPGKIGWPNTDPVSRLLDVSDQRPSVVAARRQLSEIIASRGSPYFVGTFLSQAMREQAHELGAQPVQRTNPVDINKASFRTAAATHGYTISEGLVVESEVNIPKMAGLALDTIIHRIANDSPYELGEDEATEGWTTLWLKLQDGSGGDFVKKVFVPKTIIENLREPVENGLAEQYPPATIAAALAQMPEHANALAHLEHMVIDARNEVRSTLAAACEANDYGHNVLERMWPKESFAPTAVSMVCEQDARVMGKMLANASNVVIINEDGSYRIDGYFKQVTGSDGSYRGSYPFSPRAEFGADVADRLTIEMDSVVSWLSKLGFRGRIGVDFFVMQDPQDQVHLLMTEVNGRAPISGISKVIAEKLSAPAWLNINIEAPGELNSMDDFNRAFGEFAAFTPGDFSSARVLPQAMRALYDGEELVYPSKKVKALIVGPSMEACFELRQELSKRGFVL